MNRRRIIENPRAFSGRDEAIKIRETFQNKPYDTETEMGWNWPKTMRHIGDGFAVMYRSDKWHKKGEFENYKHLCESKKPWKLYAAPGFRVEGIPLAGETKDVPQSQMPESFAVLANCLGIQCRLFEPGSRHRANHATAKPTGEDSLYEIQIARSKLAAGRTRAGHTFLCIYIESEGPQLFVFGTELDVLKDGIVG